MTNQLRDPNDKTRPCGVFAREEILGRMALPVSDVRSLVITPLFDKDKALDSDSVDCGLVPTSSSQERSPRRIIVRTGRPPLLCM